MPRVSGEVDYVVVPGVYSQLLERESRWVGRVTTQAQGRSFFERPDRLLEALEAGVPVVVPRWVIQGLPWSSAVRFVEVTPHDEVQPSDAQVGHPGCRADSVKGVVKHGH